ncbi:MAG TPA: DMT family transporter [Labilithrix sp.]|nr:DMT family transporter [Labilithrix sp.]
MTTDHRSATVAGNGTRAVGYLMVAIAATGWGTWPLILRHAAMPSSLSSAILMVVLTLGSLPVMLKDRVRVRARPKHWLAVGWLGLSDALNIALFFAAYQRTSVAIAVLTHYLTPVFVALAAPLVLGERLVARTLVAVAASFLGLMLLLAPWEKSLAPSDLLGAALGAASAVFYASNVLVNKRLAHVFSASELMFFHGFVAIPLLLAMVPRGALAAASGASIAVVVAGATGPGLIGGLTFVWGLRRIAASHASILTLLEPFVAVITAALFLGQTLRSAQIVGGGLILIGAVIVVSARTATTCGDEVDSGRSL